jgi:putative tryptophan/tyrosine transport system substrate-binding protein
MNRRKFVGLAGGAVATGSLPLRAQQPAKAYRIAIFAPVQVSQLTLQGDPLTFRPFFEELNKLGYFEGKNLEVERYSALDLATPLGELAGDVVRRKPDLIFANTTSVVRALKQETATIPIVASMGDPVTHGVVSSLARPGGNITGVSSADLDIVEKRLELLKVIKPTLSKVGFVTSRYIWDGPARAELHKAAEKLGISLFPAIVNAIQESEYRRVYAEMEQKRLDAALVSSEAHHRTYRRTIVELAEMTRLPTLYSTPDEFGGLISYGVNLEEIYRRAARQIDQILKGANPADLPIEQATKLELVINLKTAKALGLTMPPALLVRADKVIE